MADRRLALAVAALLALAGCAGVGTPAESALTVTPAPVPTDPEPTPVSQLAPGLAPEGVVDPLALAAAHVAVLDSTSYRVRAVEHVETLEGDLVEHRVLEGTVEGPARFHLDLTRETARGPDPSSSRYANGDRLDERLVTTDGTRYSVLLDSFDRPTGVGGVPLGTPTRREELSVALSGSDPASAGATTPDGATHHRLVATRAGHPAFHAARAYVDAVEAYAFVALVREDGLVSRHEVRYVAVVGGERRRVTRDGALVGRRRGGRPAARVVRRRPRADWRLTPARPAATGTQES